MSSRYDNILFPLLCCALAGPDAFLTLFVPCCPLCFPGPATANLGLARLLFGHSLSGYTHSCTSFSLRSAAAMLTTVVLSILTLQGFDMGVGDEEPSTAQVSCAEDLVAASSILSVTWMPTPALGQFSVLLLLVAATRSAFLPLALISKSTKRLSVRLRARRTLRDSWSHDAQLGCDNPLCILLLLVLPSTYYPSQPFCPALAYIARSHRGLSRLVQYFLAYFLGANRRSISFGVCCEFVPVVFIFHSCHTFQPAPTAY